MSNKKPSKAKQILDVLFGDFKKASFESENSTISLEPTNGLNINIRPNTEKIFGCPDGILVEGQKQKIKAISSNRVQESFDDAEVFEVEFDSDEDEDDEE